MYHGVMQSLRAVFFSWLLLAAVVSGLCLITYAAVQQNYRQSLNDPQIQMAEDAAYALAHGAVPADIVPHGQQMVDIAQSLAPWIGVYDIAGKPLESSGVLENAPPQPPQGVFDTSTWMDDTEDYPKETPFTWQPQNNVRQALVIVRFDPPEGLRGFVVAGRNMREVEDRIGSLGHMMLVAWFLGLVGTLALALGLRLVSSRQ